MVRVGITVLFACALAACATHRGVEVPVQTRDYGFVDEILSGDAGSPRQIDGQLSFPDNVNGPVPAVVLVHSSLGRDAQVWMYARRLNEMGFATLALDSFGPRGFTEIEYDQTVVTEASMMSDAFAALELLSQDPRIDSDRIGIFGISKGALPAVFSSQERFARALAPGGERFAFHIAYYPWCGIRFQDPQPTGAPVLILTGERDSITPPELCESMIADWRVHDPAVPVQMAVYPGARHAFDHPMLAYLPAVPLQFLVPHQCFIEEVAPGEFIEEFNGSEVTAETFSQVLSACSDAGFLAGGNRRAASAAWARTVAELRPFAF